MRIVLDTNVLVSAVIRPTGGLGRMLKHLRDGDYTLLYSQSSLTELVDVLMRPAIQAKYGITPADVEAVVVLVLLRGEAVVVTRRITACRDPKDDRFLEVAVAGRADALVTGDKDLLVLHPFETIPILSPVAFLACLEQDARLDTVA
jgi:uncharacterized protein